MKSPQKVINPAFSLLLIAGSLSLASVLVFACTDCVFGPTIYVRAQGGPSAFTPSFTASAGPGVADLNDLGTAGADGSVTLNGVTLMALRAVTGEVGPRHLTVPVTLLANNNLVIKLTGKKGSKLQVTVTQTASPCYPHLPQPALTLLNVAVNENGSGLDYYYLGVANSIDYPDALFASSPDLPPCGLNTSASRTWVDIYNGVDNSYIYGFCALGAASDLNRIWFALPTGTTPPSSVYITLTDRLCNNYIYTSTSLSLP